MFENKVFLKYCLLQKNTKQNKIAVATAATTTNHRHQKLPVKSEQVAFRAEEFARK